MKIVDKLGRAPAFSFEFFPPQNQEGVDRLFETITHLAPYEPAYVSVTYGAGGSTRRLTVELVRRIKQEVGIEAMAHLTCVGASKDEIKLVLDELEQSGIENVIALRGDPPAGQKEFVKHEGGFGYASELIAFIRSRYRFCLAAACYPEKHSEARDLESDLRALKQKVDAGVDVLITQLFFDNADYFRFVERLRAAGIDVPVLPGIIPIASAAQVERLVSMCGASVPDVLQRELQARAHDPAAAAQLGIAYATAQCAELLDAGVAGLHFYTFNRSPATLSIVGALRAQGRWASAVAPH